jgi:hypothetical protein
LSCGEPEVAGLSDVAFIIGCDKRPLPIKNDGIELLPFISSRKRELRFGDGELEVNVDLIAVDGSHLDDVCKEARFFALRALRTGSTSMDSGESRLLSKPEVDRSVAAPNERNDGFGAFDSVNRRRVF